MSFAAPLSPSAFSLKDFPESAHSKPFSFSAGQMLRKARESNKLTLDDISRRLCLSKNILEALEEGRYQELSQGEAYVIGFVRSYARLVGIDPQRVTLQMKEELPPPENPPELIFPAPLPATGHPKKLSLLFSILVTVGGIFCGQEFLIKKNLSNLSFAPHHTPFVPVQVTVDEPKDAQSLAQEPKQVASQEKKLSSLSAPSSEKADFFSLIDNKSAQAVPFLPAAGVQAIDLPQATGDSLILEATEKSWVEVRDTQGNSILNKVMQPGETYEIHGSDALFLSTGNMGGLRIHQGDNIIHSLGKSGAVRHKIPLTLAALKKASQSKEP